MRDRYIYLLGVIIAVMALYFFNKSKLQKVVSDIDDETIEDVIIGEDQSEPINNIIVSETGTVSAPITEVKVINQLSDEVLRRFGLSLAEIQKCLVLPEKLNLGNLVNPSVESLLSVVRPQFGEVIVHLDDWEQFDFLDKSNLKKRVRVDIDYPDGINPTRRLSMYTVNSYGSLEIDNLTNDQADNPNISYIESLKEGVQLLNEEKSSRMYFHQGEELAYTLKNGVLDTFSINRADRAINCSNMSNENSRCSCP